MSPEVEFVITILRATCGQDHGAFWKLFRHFGEVTAAFLATVATRHNDKALDGTGLDGIDNFISQSHDLVVSKAAHDRSGFDFSRCF